MKMYIPRLGDSIRLIADWKFSLFNEDRNQSLMEYLKDPRQVSYRRDLVGVDVVIPFGEILKLDRIYVRRGAKEFDSVTFFWAGKKTEPKVEYYRDGRPYKIPARPVRFWAKMDDVNNIEFEQVNV